MSSNNERLLSGVILEEELELSLGELTQACCVRTDFVVELVGEGILEPVDVHSSDWTFTGDSLTRLRTALNLQRDLDLNIAGIALALALLDEINQLRAQLARQPEETF